MNARGYNINNNYAMHRIKHPVKLLISYYILVITWHWNNIFKTT